MEYQNFDCEIRDGCATVRLIGPGQPDLGEMCDEWVDLMLRLQEDNTVRSILVTDGDHAFDFDGGLDGISAAHARGAGFDLLAADEEISRRIVTLIAECPKPVIAATRGDIRVQGLVFFMAADVRLAGRTATFTAQNLTAGLVAGWGVHHNLARTLGPGRTLEFLWSGRTVGAEEAWQLGLVDRLLPDATWEEELDRFTERLRRLPQPAVLLTKLAVQQAATMDMTSMLSVEWESRQRCWDSQETAEGMRAWAEQRDPELEVVVDPDEDD